MDFFEAKKFMQDNLVRAFALRHDDCLLYGSGELPEDPQEKERPRAVLRTRDEQQSS